MDKVISIVCDTPCDAAGVSYRSGMLLASSRWRWPNRPVEREWLEEKNVRLCTNAFWIYALPIRFVVGQHEPYFNGGSLLPVRLIGG